MDRGPGSGEVYSAAHRKWPRHWSVMPVINYNMREGEGRIQNDCRIAGLDVWWTVFSDSGKEMQAG